MELKDVILSTLAEMEDDKLQKEERQSTSKTAETLKPKIQKERNISVEEEKEVQKEEIDAEDGYLHGNEMLFLRSMRERLLVLFEGFQAPNNTNIEAKVDMTLNFLEYVLVSIDSRIDELEKARRNESI